MGLVYCVGLTGNIASGKSTVADMFEGLGVKCIDADQISRSLTAIAEPAYKQIVTHFGSDIVLPDGHINRRHLRQIIFSKPQERNWLESILHPLIREEIINQIADCTSPYCMIEIPLLKDRVGYPYLNKILLVTAPLPIQLSRIIARDHCHEEQAMAIISTQPRLDMLVKIADDVIENDSDLNTLLSKIKRLHGFYLQDANHKDEV
ncbi:MAG: dephospho-CoA kinase [Legionella sp.]|nr:dephospho-CoA kinase [Legionella sp.]